MKGFAAGDDRVFHVPPTAFKSWDELCAEAEVGDLLIFMCKEGNTRPLGWKMWTGSDEGWTTWYRQVSQAPFTLDRPPVFGEWTVFLMKGRT